jgi:hypothetical protein
MKILFTIYLLSLLAALASNPTLANATSSDRDLGFGYGGVVDINFGNVGAYCCDKVRQRTPA